MFVTDGFWFLVSEFLFVYMTSGLRAFVVAGGIWLSNLFPFEGDRIYTGTPASPCVLLAAPQGGERIRSHVV